jgi:hypothetical protein
MTHYGHEAFEMENGIIPPLAKKLIFTHNFVSRRCEGKGYGFNKNAKHLSFPRRRESRKNSSNNITGFQLSLE